jgi:putative intracellular protease/amidase
LVLIRSEHVYYPLIEAGYTVDFASPRGGAAPIDEGSRKRDDPENKRFLEDKAIVEQIQNTIPLSEVDPKKYQVIHFAGGHGVMWDFHNNEDLNRVAAAIYENGGIVTAVCHGPAALVNVKLSNGRYLVDGKDVNSFTNSEEEEVGLAKAVPFLLESKLKERGAKFYAGKNWENKVVVSDRLITAKIPNRRRLWVRKSLNWRRQQTESRRRRTFRNGTDESIRLELELHQFTAAAFGQSTWRSTYG